MLINQKLFYCSFKLHFPVSNVEHIFIYLLAICMPSFKKYLFRASAQFKKKWVSQFLYMCVQLQKFLIFLDIDFLSDICFTNMFFHFIGCFFLNILFLCNQLIFKLYHQYCFIVLECRASKTKIRNFITSRLMENLHILYSAPYAISDYQNEI